MTQENIKQVYSVPVKALVEYEKNPRIGNIDAIAESLKVNGQYRPIVVRRETREILAGNHTWKASKKLKWDNIDVVYVENITDDQAKKIVLADNRLNDLAEYSVPVLTKLLQDIPDLDGTGYDEYVLTNILAAFNKTVSPDPLADLIGLKEEETITCPDCNKTWVPNNKKGSKK